MNGVGGAANGFGGAANGFGGAANAFGGAAETGGAHRERRVEGDRSTERSRRRKGKRRRGWSPDARRLESSRGEGHRDRRRTTSNVVS